MLKIFLAAAVPGGAIAVGLWYLATKCWHVYSWPITNKELKQTYVVCVECGKEFKYDWTTMKVGEELPRDWNCAAIARSRIARLGRLVDEAKKRYAEGHPDPWPTTAAKDPTGGQSVT